MALPRYLTVLGLSALVLYLLTVGGSTALFRGLGLEKKLDNGSVKSDAFFGVSGLSADVYNRTPLVRTGPQIILLGASNTLKLPADEISAQLGHISVHNMAFSGSGPRDMVRVVDLAFEVIPPESRHDITFVMGVWYGMFGGPDAYVTQEFDDELSRYGLYRQTSSGAFALSIPRAALPAAFVAVRPFVLGARIWGTFNNTNKSMLSAILSGQAGPATVDVFAQNQASFSEEDRRAMLLQMRDSLTGMATDGGLAALEPIAARIAAAGGRFVLVDLPIPQWHANGVKAFQDYQERKKPFISALQKMPNFTYIDFQTGVPDDDFYDSVHPKPQAALEWANRLAAQLAPVIQSKTTSAK